MHDDWLVFPTEQEWRHLIHEGEKSIATHRDAQKLIQDLGGGKIRHPGSGAILGKAQALKKLKEGYWNHLHRLLMMVADNKVTNERAEGAMRQILTFYYRQAYALGLQTSGVGQNIPTQELVNKFNESDRYHVRTMVEEELSYVRRFFQTVREQNYEMPYYKRLKMYVEGLDGIYSGARVAALPNDSLLFWYGPVDKNKCASCTYLQNASPFLPSTLPTTPRAGDTVCLCLTNCHVEIETDVGTMSFNDVKPGDRVLTHKGRYRRVLKKTINKSVKRHKYAIMIAPDYSLIGITDDHRVWTRNGWMSAREVANEGETVLCRLRSGGDRSSKQDRTMPVMFDEATVAWSARQEDATYSSGCPRTTASSLRRAMRKLFQHAEERWSDFCAILGWGYHSVCVPLSLGVGAEAWPCTERVCPTPQERRLCGRSSGESGTEGIQEARLGSRSRLSSESTARNLSALWKEVQGIAASVCRRTREILLQGVQPFRQLCRGEPYLPTLRNDVLRKAGGDQEGSRKVLLSALLQQEEIRGNQDPCMQLLRKDLQTKKIRDQEVQVGQVLLLSSVLEEGSNLYDLEVEDDHSFVANGLVVHNSNCRDRIAVRQGTPEELRMAGQGLTREQHMANLKRIAADKNLRKKRAAISPPSLGIPLKRR